MTKKIFIIFLILNLCSCASKKINKLAIPPIMNDIIVKQTN
jgi:hypothetical protein